jgi:tRNA A-37 threonylcarbamoyl transferase component Bud32
MDPANKRNASAPEVQETRPMPTLDVDLSGKTIGDYKITRLLGKGGMGQVYLAEQISLKRQVALKFLKPDLAANQDSLKRFKAEAEAVAKATHAAIVQVYAIGELNGLNFMALEYVEGRNLQEYLDKKGTLEVLLGLSIMRQVAGALQRASELGIVHRDIKPENILLTRKGEVKVTDFGLSRVLYDESGAQGLNLTKTGMTMGTPLYMSPEQVEGKKTIDHRTDIYSFGVTCYHMFAGNPPFKGTGPFEVALQHVQSRPQPLSEIRPDLPPELCVIIHKMMAKTPEARYQSGREIARDVARLRDTVVGVAQTMNVSAQARAGASTATARFAPAAAAGGKSFWPRLFLLLILPLALAGGLVLGWYRHRADDFPASPPPVAAAPNPAREREKLLISLIEEQNAKSFDPLDFAAGLKYSIELGLLYLKDPDRLADADKFFSKLSLRQVPAYKILGKLGSAMVLAFKNEPEQSNKLILQVVDKEKVEKVGRQDFWKNNLAMREMMAKALYYNQQNNPAAFPEKLKIYLHPPAPTLKSP